MTTTIPNLKFGGWAKTISRNFCIDQVRKFKPTMCEDYQTSKLSDEIDLEYDDLFDKHRDLSCIYFNVVQLYKSVGQ